MWTSQTQPVSSQRGHFMCDFGNAGTALGNILNEASDPRPAGFEDNEAGPREAHTSVLPVSKTISTSHDDSNTA
jgi:hypothetical protein